MPVRALANDEFRNRASSTQAVRATTPRHIAAALFGIVSSGWRPPKVRGNASAQRVEIKQSAGVEFDIDGRGQFGLAGGPRDQKMSASF